MFDNTERIIKPLVVPYHKMDDKSLVNSKEHKVVYVPSHLSTKAMPWNYNAIVHVGNNH